MFQNFMPEYHESTKDGKLEITKNTFRIEPGIYLAGAFGVRVEDVVVINEKGEREILNHATKDLIVL